MRSALRCIFEITRWFLFLGLLTAAGIYLWRSNAFAQDGGAVMEAIFIETRNDADAIALINGKSCVLVDTGEDSDAETILTLLAEKSVEEIGLMILTHPDSDHIGGAKHIIEALPVKRVVQTYYPKENERLEELNKLLGEKKIPVTYPTYNRRFYVGGMKLIVYPPLEKHYRRDNDYSLAVLVSHASVNMVLPGDAEEKRLCELLEIHWPKTALYKAAHHGRAAASSEAFIRELSPDFVVVTSSGSDEAIHAASEAAGARLFYTGDGTAVFESDGTSLTFIPSKPEVRD